MAMRFGLRSLTGHPLEGTRIVRIAYVDEAGTSNPKEEPYLVVAGVMLHGDRDMPKLQGKLERLAKAYQLPTTTCFHAMDIFHGNGLFDRYSPKWPIAKRRKL